jgi:membrane protein
VSTRAGSARRYRKPLIAFRWCDIKALLGESFNAWNNDNATRLGAALAFYTLFSLTPLLLVVVSVAGMVFGRAAAEGQIVWQISDLVGPTGAKAVQALLQAAESTSRGVVASSLGIVTLLFGASGVLLELRGDLNTIWHVPTPPTTGFKGLILMVKERLFSFGLVLAIGFVLLVSLAISAWLAALGKYSSAIVPLSAAVLHVVNVLVSFAVITGLFAAIFKVMPEVHIEWRDVLLGAAVTSALFTAGKFLIGLYLGRASFASSYGAAASIVIFIIWVYYSAQVFFLGAEFTRVFAHHYGTHPKRQSNGTIVVQPGKQQPAQAEPKIIISS